MISGDVEYRQGGSISEWKMPLSALSKTLAPAEPSKSYLRETVDCHGNQCNQGHDCDRSNIKEQDALRALFDHSSDKSVHYSSRTLRSYSRTLQALALCTHSSPTMPHLSKESSSY